MATEVLILRDSEGNLYQLPRHVLDAARVPAERVRELEESLGPEVVGHGGFGVIEPTFSLDVLKAVHAPPNPQPQHFDFIHGDAPPH